MKPAEEKQTVSNKELAARMLAVQAMYQVLHTGGYIPDIIKEYLDARTEMDLDEGRMARPDGKLFVSIMENNYARLADINEIVKANISGKDGKPSQDIEKEPLLHAVLLCGVCEVLCHTDIPPALIINDYLDVAHGFYEKGQVGLVNAVLDAAASAIRS